MPGSMSPGSTSPTANTTPTASFADWVREAAADIGANVALLQDIQGPKLRLGTMPDGKVQLDRGEQIDLVPGATSGDSSHIPVDYEHLLEDVAPGRSVLVADGLVRLEVAERLHDRLRCVVVAGGELADHKGVAFPGSELRVPSLTEKDMADIAFGRELGVDYVAMSFVRSADDIRQVAALVEPGTPIIAKVELAAAYENLDDILSAADGVMVARGDLGVELPLEKIPLVQADILERTNATGLLTITATEMLQSMVEAPRPTRAEVTDVATAVTEGTDAVMLSGETAVGKYPVEAVRMMDTICREVETGLRPQRRTVHPKLSSVPTFASAIANAAVEAAVDLDLSTIVAFTETGSTARLLSKYRPAVGHRRLHRKGLDPAPHGPLLGGAGGPLRAARLYGSRDRRRREVPREGEALHPGRGCGHGRRDPRQPPGIHQLDEAPCDRGERPWRRLAA